MNIKRGHTFRFGRRERNAPVIAEACEARRRLTQDLCTNLSSFPPARVEVCVGCDEGHHQIGTSEEGSCCVPHAPEPVRIFPMHVEGFQPGRYLEGVEGFRVLLKVTNTEATELREFMEIKAKCCSSLV